MNVRCDVIENKEDVLVSRAPKSGSTLHVGSKSFNIPNFTAKITLFLQHIAYSRRFYG